MKTKDNADEEFITLLKNLELLAGGDELELEKIERFKHMLEKSFKNIYKSKDNSPKKKINNKNFIKTENDNNEKIQISDYYVKFTPNILPKNKLNLKIIPTSIPLNFDYHLNYNLNTNARNIMKYKKNLMKNSNKNNNIQKMYISTKEDDKTCEQRKCHTSNNKASPKLINFNSAMGTTFSTALASSHIFNECKKNETKAKKLKFIINKDYTNTEKFKNNFKNNIKKITSNNYKEETEVFRSTAKLLKSKNYLLYKDYNNDTKVIAENKNNIFDKLNFVNRITERTAYEMKDHLNGLFLRNSDYISQNKLSHINSKKRPISSIERLRGRNIDYEEINKNHMLIKKMIKSSQEIRNKVFKIL